MRAGNLHLEQQLNTIETRLDGLDSRLRDVVERLTRLEESKRIVMWVIGFGVPILIGVALILVRLWMG